MTRADDFQIVERTPLSGERAIVTARRRSTFSLRPFVTFLSLPSSRYASRMRDFSCEQSADLYHKHLVETLAKEGKGQRNDDATAEPAKDNGK